MIHGTVLVPAGLIAINSGGVVSDHGGSLISENGASYRLLTVKEAPLANAEVFLADASGNPLPEYSAIKTDNRGTYAFLKVPKGTTFVIKVRHPALDGKRAVLQTLVKSEADDNVANLTIASTFVVAALLAGRDGVLGELNAQVFARATASTGQQLEESDVASLSDRAKMVSRMELLAASVVEIKDALTQLRQDLADIKEALKRLEERLDRQSPVPGISTSPSFVAETTAPLSPSPAVATPTSSPPASGISTAPPPSPSSTPVVLSSTPTSVPSTTNSGVTLGTFAVGSRPVGIAIDGAGKVWVTNSGSANVTKLSATGATLGTFSVGSRPDGIAIDGTGNAWVTSTTIGTIKNNVIKLSSEGATLGTYAMGRRNILALPVLRETLNTPLAC